MLYLGFVEVVMFRMTVCSSGDVRVVCFLFVDGGTAQW